MGEIEQVGKETNRIRFKRRFLMDMKRKQRTTKEMEEEQDPIRTLNAIIQAQENEDWFSSDGEEAETTDGGGSCPTSPQGNLDDEDTERVKMLLEADLEPPVEIEPSDPKQSTTVPPRMFKCGKCVGIFSSQKSLTIHKLQRHMNGGGPTPPRSRTRNGPIVRNGHGSSSSSLSSLLQQQEEQLAQDELMRGMNPMDILKCTYCPREFPNPSTLRVHMNTHTRERPYECHYCQKRFFQSSHLTVHIRTHTGEKPYQCQFCNNAFNSPSNCRVHERTHMKGNEIFQCEECNIGFLHKSRLERHFRSRKHVHPGGVIPRTSAVVSSR